MEYLENLLPEQKNLSIDELEKLLVQGSLDVDDTEKNFALCLIAIKKGLLAKFEFYFNALVECTDETELDDLVENLFDEEGSSFHVLFNYKKNQMKKNGNLKRLGDLQLDHVNYILVNRLINLETEIFHTKNKRLFALIQNSHKGQYDKAFAELLSENEDVDYDIVAANLNLGEARRLLHEKIMFQAILRKLELNFSIYTSYEMREFEKEALRLFANLLTLNPDKEDYLNALCLFYVKTENVKSLKAIQDLRPNLKIFSDKVYEDLINSRGIAEKVVTETVSIQKISLDDLEIELDEQDDHTHKANEILILKWLKERDEEWLGLNSYDYMVNLLMTKFYDCVLFLCESVERTSSTLLIEVDCLLGKKEYYRAIDLMLLFLSTCEDPKAELHVKYYLAEAYRKTKQTKQALNLLKEIKKANSNYRLVSERIAEIEGN